MLRAILEADNLFPSRSGSVKRISILDDYVHSGARIEAMTKPKPHRHNNLLELASMDETAYIKNETKMFDRHFVENDFVDELLKAHAVDVATNEDEEAVFAVSPPATPMAEAKEEKPKEERVSRRSKHDKSEKKGDTESVPAPEPPKAQEPPKAEEPNEPPKAEEPKEQPKAEEPKKPLKAQEPKEQPKTEEPPKAPEPPKAQEATKTSAPARQSKREMLLDALVVFAANTIKGAGNLANGLASGGGLLAAGAGAGAGSLLAGAGAGAGKASEIAIPAMGRAAAAAAPPIGQAIASGAQGVGAAIQGIGTGVGQAASGAGLLAGHYLRGKAHAIALEAWQRGIRMSQLAYQYIQQHPMLSGEEQNQLLADAHHEDQLLQLEDEKSPVVGPATELLQPPASKPRRASSPPPEPKAAEAPKPAGELRDGIRLTIGKNGKNYFHNSQGKFVKQADAYK